jgi:hypothetical protein
MICRVPLCWALGKEFFYFFKNFAECPYVWHLAKIFLKKILCLVLTILVLGKENIF